MTVDDERGNVGATQRAVLGVNGPAAIDAAIGSSLSEAMATCQASGQVGELAPGDYTVILHPAAVQDLMSTALLYGLYDQRKIDERRTFLSGKVNELRFPEGLRLAQPLSLPVADGGAYADLPLNHRYVPCSGLELISGGKLRDLHVSPYWAKQTGKAETFAVHAAPPTLLAAEVGSPLAGQYPDLAALIAGTERGVFIANLWYLRMVAEMDGTLTGMTRDGVFAIENGKLAGPLLNMRWHDNPFRILGAVTGMTDERRIFGRSRLAGPGRTSLCAMPALRVDGFHFSSVTKF
jgi:predicted Zn-dependent protease